jgi:hypothetical protein
MASTRSKSSSKSSSSRKGGAATKSPRKYKALRRKGMPKSRAAKIANSGKAASRKGGKHSHGGRSRSSKK